MNRAIHKSNAVNKCVLFIVWPFFAFLHSFFNGFRKRHDFLILFLFSGFVGLSLAVDYSGADIQAYVDLFLTYKDESFSEFWQNIANFFTLKSVKSDIGLYIISFLVSKISLVPQALYLTLGLIFGFFYAKIIRFAGLNYSKKGIVSFILFTALVFYIFPTQAINQRFWIAGIMLMYGIQKNIFFNDKSSYGYILFSPLIHLGIFPLVAVFFLFKLTSRIKVHFLILLIPVALFFSFNFSAIAEPLALYFGGAVEGKFEAYAGDYGTSLSEVMNKRVWYAVYSTKVLLICLSLIILLMTLRVNRIKGPLGKLIRLNIYLIAIAALVSNFSMNFRYFELISYVQFYTIFLYAQAFVMTIKFKFFFLLAIPSIFLALGLKVTAILQFLKPTVLITNLATGWFIKDIKSLWWFLDFI